MEAEGPRVAGTTIGDALRALARLRPRNQPTVAAILALLQLSARSPAAQAAVARTSSDGLAADEPEATVGHEARPLRLVSDAEPLPPLLDSELEEIGSSAAPPPGWLDSTPPIALPVTIANPFRQPGLPLFEPKWQRAIVTQLASISLPVGELDIPQVIQLIARGRPLTEVPRRPVATVAKGLRLLIDQGESMEPYRLDVAELVRSFRRTIGAARVSAHGYRGLPEWGCHAGLEPIAFRPPPSGVPVVVIGDLGLPPRAAAAMYPTQAEWCSFLQRLERGSHHCRVVVPRDVGELPASLRRHGRLVPWGRRTLASRLEQTEAGTGEVALVQGANIVALGDLGGVHSGALELGVLGSLAVRIEPQLLRALRLQLAPQLPVSAEAELWFSPLVADRAATGIVLEPRRREVLQRLLRSDGERLARAYAITGALHREAAAALRVEEELGYRWLTGNIDAARGLLRRLVATLVAPQRAGLSKWAVQALVRLPHALASLEEAQMLALGAALRTGETAQLRPALGGGSSWHWLRPATREIELGVNLRRGLIEFGPRSMRAAHRIRVPDSNPVVLEIHLQQPAEEIQRVRLNPLARTVVEIAGDAVEIGALGGARWLLREAQKAHSRQKFIARNRAPRVRIEYDVEVYGAVKKVQLPFVLAVMADLSGKPVEALPPVAERMFRLIDVDNFDVHLAACRPRVAFHVPDTLGGKGYIAVDLNFNALDDFAPVAVARQLPALSELLDARQGLAATLVLCDDVGAEKLVARLLGDAAQPHPVSSGSSVPSQSSVEVEFEALLQRSLRSQATEATSRQARAAVQALVQQARVRPGGRDAAGMVEIMIAEIDRKLSAQLNLILHHEDFQRLESAWRGLHYLVMNTETDEALKIHYLHLSKAELGRTLRRHSGALWDKGALFSKIYEEKFGTFGGEPYGCLVGDYYFDHSPDDVATLSELGRIAAAAHCPFIAGASPALMQMSSWQELANRRDLTKIFLTPEYAAWRSLRESDDARYIGLAMPRFLARLPYGAKTSPVDEFNFEEDTGAADHSCYTWANAAYAMAVNINRSFKLYGWLSRIRGIESGGAVEGLPLHSFPTDDGGVEMKSPTEIAIFDRREAELAKNGFMPMMYRKNSGFAAFIGAQSLQKPFEYDDPDATANANLAARLPYLFACCRFVHYVKCITRDKIGTFKDGEALQLWLQDWLRNYVDSDPARSSEAARAQKPLAAADISVEEVEGPPRYLAKLYLRPHYQLEGLTASLRLLTHLPKAG